VSTLFARAAIGRTRRNGWVARHRTRRRVRNAATAIPAGCLLSRYCRSPVSRDRPDHGVLRRHRHVTSAPWPPTIANTLANDTRLTMSTNTMDRGRLCARGELVDQRGDEFLSPST